MMILHVQFLENAENVRENLLRDGWRAEPQPDGSLIISHPQVSDEEAARERLDQLGVLTSQAIRLDFEPPSLGPEPR